jgi:two-component system phosphate regulon response regulator PhoB
MAEVLIVDDNLPMVEMLATVLELFGHTARPATSGEQGLAEVVRHRPDIVLLDWMMPGIDGCETLRRLRGMPGCDSLPVVVVTAAPDRELDIKVELAGGNACVRKPIDMEALADLIAFFAPAAAAVA